MPKLKNDIEHSIEIKKSKFITYLHKTSSEEEAKEFLKLVRKAHPDARHACTAMVIGSVVRSNDDGEPAGTAGHPMLDVLLGAQMNDILAVVVRYFGGTLLGKGGLVRAYSSSVRLALEQATLVDELVLKKYRILFDYSLIGKLDAFFKIRNIEVIEKQYEEQVIYYFCSKEDISTLLKETTSGNIEIEYLEDVICEAELVLNGG
ncbi:hypothetical protein C815_01543 [Firmicutes bacterium M10-2]|nr:hypothetical protein C815_01543 [Firmicutes bacterium M10-2]